MPTSPLPHHALNARFAIPDTLQFDAGQGGLTCLNITTRRAAATVYLHGAQVTSFTPAGEADLLFLSEKSHFSPDKAIRGGIPLCFPWFAAGPDAAHPQSPAHGIARLCEWNLTHTQLHEDDSLEIVLQLPPRADLPATQNITLTITIADTLDLRLRIANRSSDPFQCEAALHSYLAVADVRRISIAGLDGQNYLNQLDGTHHLQHGSIQFTAETDRIYIDSPTTCVVHDPILRRRITVEKTGSQSTVIWNPWVDKAHAMADFGDDEWPGMVCVETAAIRTNALTLPPGEVHAIGLRLGVARD